ncbi:hypothetical protein [Micromonospora sp. WMMD964]|uniref:hypothetical protein n=1 Tax=Micromonospora sp. WMMD964 TaxID=3016091 RepID=UPI00249C8DD5|nr:hypothetical protein [Micromonospora sp. WMMD964]WFF03990.1 hypothetical protein O7616_15040 [Micromonospora sp. WMMD964]
MAMRSWGAWFGGVMLWALFGFMMVMFSRNPANGWGGLLLVAAFFVGICHLTTLATMFSYVKVTPSALLVVNPGLSTVIPWSLVQQVDAEHGLVVRVRDADDVHCYAFQPSLMGRLVGYPGAHRAVEKIESYADARTAAEDHLERAVTWKRHLLFLVGGWSVFALLVPSLVRVP